MREFFPPVSRAVREDVIHLAQALLELASKTKLVYGSDLAMTPAEVIVSRSAKLVLPDRDGSLTVAVSEPTARPPFEWIVEVTSELEEYDYLRHYLVRENDMVLAHRKVITEVDDAEAQLLLADMRLVHAALIATS